MNLTPDTGIGFLNLDVILLCLLPGLEQSAYCLMLGDCVTLATSLLLWPTYKAGRTGPVL